MSDVIQEAAAITNSALSPIKDSRPDESNPIRFATMQDLRDRESEEPPAIIQGLLVRGCTSLIEGVPKLSGKTTLMLDWTRCIVAGGEWAGKRVERCPVVYLTEQSRSSFRHQAAKAGLLDLEGVSVVFFAEVFTHSWPTLVDAVRQEVLRVGAGLVVVDTIAKWSRVDDENDATQAVRAMEPLQHLAETTNCAVAGPRHERKSGGALGEAGRGSTAWTGSADIILALRRPEGSTANPNMRRLLGISRFDSTPDELEILLDGFRYRQRGDGEAYVAPETRDAILDTLPTDVHSAVSADDVLRASGLGRTTVHQVLQDEVSCGQASVVGRGVKGSPWRYWRPVFDSSSTETPHQNTVEFGNGARGAHSSHGRASG